jgi:hypothetical protein
MSVDKEDTCQACGMWTRKGKEKLAENSKLHPIFGTDFSKPLSKIIEEIRVRLVAARGQLSDIASAHPGWGERTADVEGLLTCGLVTLYGIMEEMRKIEEQIEKERNER